MGLIIIFAVVLVLGIVLWIISERNDMDSLFGASVFMTLVNFVALCVAVGFLFTKSGDVKYQIERYNNLKDQLELIEAGDVLVPNDVLTNVLNINDMIENEKAHVDSWFNGIYYSKEVAELEHLNCPKVKDETAKE